MLTNKKKSQKSKQKLKPIGRLDDEELFGRGHAKSR
jgi:hypothetical protein